MPKVASQKKMNNNLKFAIEIKTYAKAVLGGVRQLSKKMGVCPTTLYKRLDNPKEFTIGELSTMWRVLEIDKDEFIEMLRKIL